MSSDGDGRDGDGRDGAVPVGRTCSGPPASEALTPLGHSDEPPSLPLGPPALTSAMAPRQRLASGPHPSPVPLPERCPCHRSRQQPSSCSLQLSFRDAVPTRSLRIRDTGLHCGHPVASPSIPGPRKPWSSVMYVPPCLSRTALSTGQRFAPRASLAAEWTFGAVAQTGNQAARRLCPGSRRSAKGSQSARLSGLVLCS